MSDVLLWNPDGTDFLHQSGIEVTDPVGWGSFHAMLEVCVVLIAQTLCQVVEVLGMFELRGIGNLRIFEGFDDRFGGEMLTLTPVSWPKKHCVRGMP